MLLTSKLITCLKSKPITCSKRRSPAASRCSRRSGKPARARPGPAARSLTAQIVERTRRSANLPHEDAVEVTVNGGEVTLAGTVRSREDRHRIEDLADEVRGVRGVESRLRASVR
ncbi:BON domain-containing protein [Sorangium sp. So ce233]|uniref:BON domain-containing protein n=1 Tax=Sorangium sp. So ce233 TaxID=3133290 RepID=UPI003F62275E